MPHRNKIIKTLNFFSVLRMTFGSFLSLLFTFSCVTDNKAPSNSIYLSATGISDSVKITDIGTDMEIGSFLGNKKVELPMPYSKIGKVQLAEYNSAYLTFLEPGKNIDIRVFKDSLLTTERVVDSLLNYLSTNSLDYINKNLNFIFTTDNLDSIVKMFNTYRLEREQLILDFSDRLSPSEMEVLVFYNTTRLYGFLQFYGLVPQKIKVENSFYDFVEQIDLSHNFIKSAPYLFLNKLKIQFLRQYGSLTDLSEFLDYIDEKMDGEDRSDFMKSMFIKELVESSQFWEPEHQLLNMETLEKMLDQERDTEYYHFIESFSNKFLLTQKGREAYNFKGERPDGSTFELEDLNGKVVFIDVWATWCAPCLIARPKVIDIANKFKDDANLKVLMVSVDDSREKWLKFMNDNPETSITNIFIEDGMKKDFGRQFNINYIPNYILIDKQGLIVDAYIKEPSMSVEEMIVKELSK